MLDRMTVPGQSQPVPYGRMPQPDPMGRPAPPGRPERTNRPAQPAPTSFPAERHSTAGGQDAAGYGLSPGYGIVPSAYGGDPSARGGPAPAGRKRRTVLVIALVAALVLAAGGGLAVWVLRDRGDRSAADSRDRWSSAWLDGAEEVWSLDAPAGAGGMSTIKVVKDKLIRVMNGNGSATITVFRLGDGTPEQLWEEEFGINETYWLNIWEGQIVVGNTLVNIDSQEHATAPWNPDASVGRVKDGVVACSGTTCELWTSMTDKKWETEIPASSSLIPQTSQVVGDHTLVRTSEKEPDYFFLDLTSGETVPVEGEEEVNPPYELADGWFSAGTDYRAGTSTTTTTFTRPTAPSRSRSTPASMRPSPHTPGPPLLSPSTRRARGSGTGTCPGLRAPTPFRSRIPHASPLSSTATRSTSARMTRRPQIERKIEAVSAP